MKNFFQTESSSIDLFFAQKDLSFEELPESKAKCFNKQMTAKSKISTLKKSGFTITASSQGLILTQPNTITGRFMNAHQVTSLVSECFGDNCDLVMPPENPLWTVSEIGNGKFLVKFDKEIF